MKYTIDELYEIKLELCSSSSIEMREIMSKNRELNAKFNEELELHHLSDLFEKWIAANYELQMQENKENFICGFKWGTGLLHNSMP